MANNTEKMIAEFDQNSETILRVIPTFLHNYYEKLIKVGFNKIQAFELVKKYHEIIIRGV